MPEHKTKTIEDLAKTEGTLFYPGSSGDIMFVLKHFPKIKTYIFQDISEKSLPKELSYFIAKFDEAIAKEKSEELKHFLELKRQVILEEGITSSFEYITDYLNEKGIKTKPHVSGKRGIIKFNHNDMKKELVFYESDMFKELPQELNKGFDILLLKAFTDSSTLEVSDRTTYLNGLLNCLKKMNTSGHVTYSPRSGEKEKICNSDSKMKEMENPNKIFVSHKKH